MNMNTFDRLPAITAVVLIVLVIAACTIRLRGEDNQAPSANSLDRAADPMAAAALEQCLSLVSDQPEALTECRKVWVEKRREFLGKASPTSPERHPALSPSPLFVTPKDEGGLRHGPSGDDPNPQPGHE